MTKLTLAVLAVLAAAPAFALDLEAHFGKAANDTVPAPAAGHVVLAAAQGAPIVEPVAAEAQALERLLKSYLRHDWGGFSISGGRLYAAPIDSNRYGRRRVDAVEIYAGFQASPLTIELQVNRPDVAASLALALPFAKRTSYGLRVHSNGPVDSTAQFERVRGELPRVARRAFERTGGWRGAEAERLKFKAVFDWAAATRVALPKGGREVLVDRVVAPAERARLRLDY